MKVDDIRGTRPQKVKFVTGRTSNPLEPDYKLPSFKVAEPVQPKFIRDAMNVDDIEGTKPKEPYFIKPRTAGEKEEIEKSKPKER